MNTQLTRAQKTKFCKMYLNGEFKSVSAKRYICFALCEFIFNSLDNRPNYETIARLPYTCFDELFLFNPTIDTEMTPITIGSKATILQNNELRFTIMCFVLAMLKSQNK